MDTPSQEKQRIASLLCANSCGFYGNPTTRNLCSKCYRNVLLRENQQAAEKLTSSSDLSKAEIEKQNLTPIISVETPDVIKLSPPKPENLAASSDVDQATVTSSPEAQPEVNSTRCFKCNKKIGLLGFQCRCSYYFCGAHRHADSHECAFDYKAFGRQQLSKANQRIVADKINRI